MEKEELKKETTCHSDNCKQENECACNCEESKCSCEENECTCEDSLTPIRLAYPIAHRRLSVQGRERAVTRRTVAYGSYCLASLIPYDCPCGRIVKHGADYL